MNEGDAERMPQRPCVICGLLPWGSRSAVSQPESAGVNYSYLIISYPDQTRRASERKALADFGSVDVEPALGLL